MIAAAYMVRVTIVRSHVVNAKGNFAGESEQ
jgi:hypothetical protein